MIRSFKMFAQCVESMRTAENTYDKDSTAANKRIMTDLQNKVDGWLVWINSQEDAGLVRDVPPFIGKLSKAPRYQGGIAKDVYDRLVANHTPEEIERFEKLMGGL